MARPKSDGALSAAERQRIWRARQAVTGTLPRNENPVTETRAVTETTAGTETPDACATVARMPAEFIRFRHCQHVPFALFDGHGRGTVRTHSDGKRYVMVARHDGPDLGELGIVTAADWSARLSRRCGHGLAGWQCHAC